MAIATGTKVRINAEVGFEYNGEVGEAVNIVDLPRSIYPVDDLLANPETADQIGVWVKPHKGDIFGSIFANPEDGRYALNFTEDELEVVA